MAWRSEDSTTPRDLEAKLASSARAKCDAAADAMTKVAVIIGAGTKWDKHAVPEAAPSVRYGLGGALCLAFAEAGLHVVLCGRRLEVLEAVAAAVATAGGAAHPVACDVTDDASVKAAFDAAAAIGAISVVVYNPGVPMPPGHDFTSLPKPHEVDPAYFASAFDVGVTGCVRAAKHAIPAMLASGGGSFLVSGATMALRGGAGYACMAPLKAALRTYSQSMYNAYAKHGIHVAHVVIDGVVDSPDTHQFASQVGQLMHPAEIAQAYVMLHQQPPTVWSHELQISTPKTNLGMRL